MSTSRSESPARREHRRGVVAAERAERLVEDVAARGARQAWARARCRPCASSSRARSRSIARRLGQLGARDEHVVLVRGAARRCRPRRPRVRRTAASRSFSNAHAATRCVAIDDRVALVRRADRLAELARVLRVARRVVARRWPSRRSRTTSGSTARPARVVRDAVLVDRVAEAVERLREADDAPRVEPEQLAA